MNLVCESRKGWEQQQKLGHGGKTRKLGKGGGHGPNHVGQHDKVRQFIQKKKIKTSSLSLSRPHPLWPLNHSMGCL